MGVLIFVLVVAVGLLLTLPPFGGMKTPNMPREAIPLPPVRKFHVSFCCTECGRVVGCYSYDHMRVGDILVCVCRQRWRIVGFHLDEHGDEWAEVVAE